MEAGPVPSVHTQPATPARRSDLGKSEATTEQEPSVEALPTTSSVDVHSADRADEEILEEPFRAENFEPEIILGDIVSAIQPIRAASFFFLFLLFLFSCIIHLALLYDFSGI